MYDLLLEMVQANLKNKFTNYLKNIAKLGVLVIEDSLLTPPIQDKQKYLMEIFELRSRNRSLIISSQMETGERHKKLGGGAITGALLNREASNSYHLYIASEFY